MNKKFYIFLFMLILSLTTPKQVLATEDNDYVIKMKQDLLVLMLSYPAYIENIEKTSDNKVYCIMKSGEKLLYDDFIKKNSEEKLSNPDLQDMLEQIYPLNKITEVLPKDIDPGRVRHYGLLNNVYGNSKQKIESNLRPLEYGYTNYQFNKENNAILNLENTLRILMPLSKTRNDICNILYPANGTYNYRLISGTNRLSPHSFGIAIDLKSDPRDYWKWSTRDKGSSRIKEYPEDLIKTFEDNNFVWGGKWSHFDILHFEYRPEIILKSKYFGNWSEDKSCYEGAPLENECTQKYIELIENALK